ncbi:MAG: transcription termination/antitermination protein NusG [Pirellulales bacterium]
MSDKKKSDSAPAGAASAGVPVMDWYIIKVAFNREDSIRDSLLKRIKLAGLESCFGEILIPTEDVVTFTRNGTRRVVKRKLYPGYLMAFMAITDDSWFLVRETPGVGDFTGSGGKPTPMDAADVAKIVKKAEPDEDGEKPMKTSIPYRAGDRVRVKEGNFQNLEGEVEKVDEANGRVTVIINIFGRSTPVELDHWQIEQL